MNVPEGLFYTENHEWVKVEDGIATIGITAHAADQLGDIVFVELPDIEDEVESGESFGVVESVKTVSDVFSPVSGKVADRNKNLLQEIDGEDNEDFHPEYVNKAPYENGWLLKIKMSDESETESLMPADEYKKHIEE